MRYTAWALLIGLFLFGSEGLAADGDLIVNGNSRVGGALTVSGNLGVGTTSPGSAIESVATGRNIFGYPNNLKLTADQYPTVWFQNQSTGWGTVLVSDVNGAIFVDRTYGGAGYLQLVIGWDPPLTVYGNVSAYGNFYSISDARYKRNVTPINNTLSLIQGLQGVSFNWRADEFKDKNFDRSRHVGLVAQDVEKVIPELVKTNKDGEKMVSYEKLTVVLLEAIKEQQKEIKELKSEMGRLKKR